MLRIVYVVLSGGAAAATDSGAAESKAGHPASHATPAAAAALAGELASKEAGAGRRLWLRPAANMLPIRALAGLSASAAATAAAPSGAQARAKAAITMHELELRVYLLFASTAPHFVYARPGYGRAWPAAAGTSEGARLLNSSAETAVELEWEIAVDLIAAALSDPPPPPPPAAPPAAAAAAAASPLAAKRGRAAAAAGGAVGAGSEADGVELEVSAAAVSAFINDQCGRTRPRPSSCHVIGCEPRSAVLVVEASDKVA